MFGKHTNKHHSFALTLIIAVAHFAGLLVTLLVALVLLIGVYHTSIFLIAFALPALFKFVIPTVTLALAAGILFLKHPVHSLLCLITVFFTTVLLFIYVGAEFLAFLFLIVYVGAIAILFLFVIMLLHLKELSTVTRTAVGGAVAVFFPTVGLTVLGMDDAISHAMFSFFSNSDLLKFKTENTSVEAVLWFVNNQFLDILTFSALLYTYYSFLFFLVSLLLLTAMLGAIILATSSTDTDDTTVIPAVSEHFFHELGPRPIASKNPELPESAKTNALHPSIVEDAKKAAEFAEMQEYNAKMTAQMLEHYAQRRALAPTTPKISASQWAVLKRKHATTPRPNSLILQVTESGQLYISEERLRKNREEAALYNPPIMEKFKKFYKEKKAIATTPKISAREWRRLKTESNARAAALQDTKK